MRSWKDESLLRRPPQEDSRCHRARHAQSSSGPHLRREPLLGQAIRLEGPTGRLPHANKELWTTPQGGRESPSPSRKGCGGAPERHRQRKTPLFGAHNGDGYERLHRKAADEAAWLLSKKRTAGALERDEFLRAAWKVMLAEQVEVKRLIFVDEMGTNTALSPLYAWAPKGQRTYWSVPRNRGANTTVLSSMSAEGMGPSLAVEGTITSVVFEAYVEQVLAPTLRSRQVVVMDNLSAHKGERIKEMIEQRGCQLVYLPAYSPDLNPIEEAFSKIKGLVRKAEARTKEALVEAIGSALSAVTSEDARSFFEHGGYRMSVQSLWQTLYAAMSRLMVRRLAHA